MTSKRSPSKPRRDLSSRVGLADSKDEAISGENLASIEREGEVSFVIGLLLDKKRQTKHMRIMHVANGEEDAWDGWQERRLLDFIIERAGLRLPAAGADLPPAAPTEQKPEAKIRREPIPAPLATPGPAPSLQSAIKTQPQAIEIVTSAGRLIPQDSVPVPKSASGILVANRPFKVRLAFDLGEVDPSQRKPLNYTANIYAKSLKGPLLQSVGAADGQLEPKGMAAVVVKGNPLPQGLYRLQAVVSLSDPALKSEHRTSSIIQTGEKLLRVA